MCSSLAVYSCSAGEVPLGDGLCGVVNVNSSTCEQKTGNPVVIGTGRKTGSFTDWASNGAFPLVFERHYSSIFRPAWAPGHSRLGNGWRSSFDSQARYVFANGVTSPALAADGDRIHIVTPDHFEHSFRKNGGVWKPVVPGKSGSSLTWSTYRTDFDAEIVAAADSVTLRLPSNDRYVYDLSGLLIRIEFANGYRQFLDYSQGLNTRVRDSFGRKMDFAYETNPNLPGMLKQVLLPDGQKLSFTYVSRLLPPPGLTLPATVYHKSYALGSVIYPDETPATDADNPRNSFEYLDSHEYPFALTGITDERGVKYLNVAYDSQGRATLSERPGGADRSVLSYDDVNNRVTVTNSLGRPTVYSYQKTYGFIQRLLAVDGVATANCAASNTVYTYDANGFRNRATDAEGRITAWTRNSRGLPLTTIEGFGTPAAVTTTTDWDATRPLLLTIQRPGLATSFAYNGNGRLASVTETDTTTTTVPYATGGQSRTTTFGYTAIAPASPPAVGPTGTPLSDVPLALVNPDAQSGNTSGWTNVTGAIGVRTTAPCATPNPCFFGGTSGTAMARQDVAVPAGNLAEVDAGQRAVKIAWKQNSYQNTDMAALRLVFLNQSGTAIGSLATAIEPETGWVSRERTGPVPPGTRTIRVQMRMVRADGTNNDGYVDDMALTLTADGPASPAPFLTVANPDALAAGISGWSLSSGSIVKTTSSPCHADYPCFAKDSFSHDRAFQDIAIPADRAGEIDNGARRVEVAWVDRVNKSYTATGIDIAFLDASNQPIANSAVEPAPASSVDVFKDRAVAVDVPPGARKIRLGMNYRSGSSAAKSSQMLSFTARLVGRNEPAGPTEVLTTVDGPLPGSSDTVTYAYGQSGNLTSVTNELGHVTQVTASNSRGQPLAIADANGVITGLAYDARGRLTGVTVNPGPSQSVTAIEYDAAGQIVKVTSPDGSHLTYVWDDARRLTSVSNNAGETIEYGYNLNGDAISTTVKAPGGAIVRQQSAVFDELGRLMRRIGAASQQWTYSYDRTDRLTQVADPRSNLYAFGYDALSRLIRETNEEAAQVNLTLDGKGDVTAYADPRGLTTTYVRNGFGEVIQESGPDLGTTVYIRDQRGLATQVTDPRGVVANMTYDAMGRLLSETYPASPADNVAYAYDSTSGGNKGVGRLTSLSDSSGSTSFVYDAHGRIVQDSRTIAGKAYVTSYAYDAAGNLMAMTYPSGRIVSFSRNSTGQATAVTTQVNAGAPVFTVASAIAWQPMSELLSGMTHGNGLVTAAAYDLDYRLTALTLMDGATAISSLSYGYGDGLNLTAVNDNVAPANSISLAYTPANRLGSASGPWGQTSYTYDAVGNRLSEVTGPVSKDSSLAPGSNRLAAVATNGMTTRSFSHDAAGNITIDQRGADTYTTTYNVRNRPTQVVRAGSASESSSYGYNALEQPVWRSTTAPGGPAGTVHYIHDLAGHLIAEADGASGSTLREYIWLAANDNSADGNVPVHLPLALIAGVSSASPVTYMVHSDHLGRPIRLTDGARATQWQATYTPFGEPFQVSGTIEQNLRFPGQYFLIETGLASNWHRHYDPTTGRYTQPDPRRFVDGPSVYAYAGSSPFVNVDREGDSARRFRQQYASTGYFASTSAACSSPVCDRKGLGRRSGLGFGFGIGSRPSRCAFLRACFLARRMASAFSRTLLSEGFS